MINLFVFDWSGTISDDRMPIYESNMKVFNLYKIPRIPFDEWLMNSPMTAVELFRNHGINEDKDKLSELYKKYYTEIIKSRVDTRHKFYTEVIESNFPVL